MTYKSSESGNVLIYILIAVALFGALSFAVSGMMRSGGESDASNETVTLAASEILDYGRKLKQAVRVHQISYGCEDTDISFESPLLPDYSHSPAAPNDCEIFTGSNATINYAKPPSDYVSGADLDWLFLGTNAVDGVGTASADLIAMLPQIKSNLCDAINEVSGIDDDTLDTTIDTTRFQGSYANTQTLDQAGGKSFGCLVGPTSGTRFFYQVLLAR